MTTTTTEEATMTLAGFISNPVLLTGFGIYMALYLSISGSSSASARSGWYAVAGIKYHNESSSNKASSFPSKFKYYIPIIISGVLGIYGLIVATLLVGKISDSEHEITTKEGIRYMFAGLAVGGCCNASGFAISDFVGNLMYNAAEATAPKPTTKDGDVKNDETTTAAATDDSGRYHEDESSFASMGRALLQGRSNKKDTTSRGVAVVSQEPSIAMLVSLVFMEALGLYGLVVALCLIGA
eukprot:CAMPEP_0119546242 /NCGR_PEP_ID=MMETSP1352-20130426/745_1 /TAXON_ID=265584 /ORGANISM="Stauroneis constricta, Strain CCMP1120" /LENGTH=239 /DNA_ID=CAMNT_0007590923 /DNA_START=82 /DNA_END=801 /DNA_ORIENTATION=+